VDAIEQFATVGGIAALDLQRMRIITQLADTLLKVAINIKCDNTVARRSGQQPHVATVTHMLSYLIQATMQIGPVFMEWSFATRLGEREAPTKLRQQV